MTFYEKYEKLLFWAWFFILISVPGFGFMILVWHTEIKEMLNEIKVSENPNKDR